MKLLIKLFFATLFYAFLTTMFIEATYCQAYLSHLTVEETNEFALGVFINVTLCHLFFLFIFVEGPKFEKYFYCPETPKLEKQYYLD